MNLHDANIDNNVEQDTSPPSKVHDNESVQNTPEVCNLSNAKDNVVSY